MGKFHFFLLVTGLGVLFSGCVGRTTPPASTETLESPTREYVTGGITMTLRLTSPAFAAGELIPAKYTCDGEDFSPPLAWNDPPAGTKSFALIGDDPDAPGRTWVHWVRYNIPADVRELTENQPNEAQLSDGSLNGNNSWKRLGYGGPCPPRGVHHYYFKLYALDTVLDLPAGATKEQLLEMMMKHILTDTELMGVYQRR